MPREPFAAKAHDGAVQLHVLGPGEFHVEARSQFDHGRDAPGGLDVPDVGE